MSRTVGRPAPPPTRRSSQLRRTGRWAAAVAALAVSVALAACGGAQTSTSAGGSTHADTAATPTQTGGTLRFARNEEPVTFDPVMAADNGSIFVIYNIFDTLVTINDESNGIEPSLATKWTTSDDGLTTTLTLRQNVQFSDGTPMTAQDVVFSLDRARAPDAGYAFLLGPIKSVKATDDHTVVIKLKERFTPLMENLSAFSAAIISKKAYQADPKGFASAPVGTGPFALKRFQKGVTTELVRNEHYWREGKPIVDAVDMPLIADDNARVLKLEAGEVDLAEAIPYGQVDQLQSRDGVSVREDPLFALQMVYLNHNRRLLADPDARRALNLAIDRDAILEKIYFGHGEVANSMTPKMRLTSSDVDPFPYDPAEAKRLIAPHAGEKLPLLIASGDSVSLQLAQVLKQAWDGIGLDVEIERVDFGNLLERLTGGKYSSLIAYITADVVSPWELPLIQFTLDSATNQYFTWYQSPRADKLIQQGVSGERDEGEAYHELQQVLMDEAPVVPLVFYPALTGVRDGVTGFHTLGTGWWRLADVALPAE